MRVIMFFTRHGHDIASTDERKERGSTLFLICMIAIAMNVRQLVL